MMRLWEVTKGFRDLVKIIKGIFMNIYKVIWLTEEALEGYFYSGDFLKSKGFTSIQS